MENLNQRMSMPKSVAEKYVQLWRLMKNPAKSGQVNIPSMKFEYSNRDDFARVFTPALREVGLAMAVSADVIDVELIAERDTGRGRVVKDFRYRVRVYITLIDSSGEQWTSMFIGEAIDQSDKGVPKAVTQAFRHWVSNSFALADGGEDWMYADEMKEAYSESKEEPQARAVTAVNKPQQPQATAGHSAVVVALRKAISQKGFVPEHCSRIEAAIANKLGCSSLSQVEDLKRIKNATEWVNNSPPKVIMTELKIALN